MSQDHASCTCSVENGILLWWTRPVAWGVETEIKISIWAEDRDHARKAVQELATNSPKGGAKLWIWVSRRMPTARHMIVVLGLSWAEPGTQKSKSKEKTVGPEFQLWSSIPRADVFKAIPYILLRSSTFSSHTGRCVERASSQALGQVLVCIFFCVCHKFKLY